MSLLNPQDLIDKFNHDIESDAIYTSTTGNIHSISANSVGKTVENGYISKVGDIPSVDTHYRGTNSAVYAEGANGKYTITNSSIKTDGLGADATASFNEGQIELRDTDILVLGDLSAGILSSSDAMTMVDSISLYTLGEDSNAVYLNNNGKAYISDSYIGSDQAATVRIEGRGILNVESSVIFNNEDNYIIEAEDSGDNNIIVNLSDVEFDNVSPILKIENTSSERINQISFDEVSFSCPTEEDVFAFNLKNTKTNITLVNSASYNGLGNLLKVTNNSTVTIDASSSNLSGNVIVDDTSRVNIIIGEKKHFVGSVTGEFATVKLTKSVWDLTEDTYLAELDIDYTSLIKKNGHLLLVDGEDYTDGVTVGSVVHYTTKAEKVYDRQIIERNCIVIKKTLNETGANEFILYDADDHLAYKAIYSEFRDTGKTVDINPILDEIEELLIGIDEYYSDSTIRTKDENTNAIIINGKVHSLDNIIVEKYNDAADGSRGMEGENATILIKNDGELNLTGSSILSDGEFATGILVRDASRLNLDTVSIETNDKYSPGVFVIDGSYAFIENSEIITNIVDDDLSDPIVLLNASEVYTKNCNLESKGISSVVHISNSPMEGHDIITTADTIYSDSGSTFNSSGSENLIVAVAQDTIEDADININLINSKINTETENTTITSLIKCRGANTPDTININLDSVSFINPPGSESFLNVDPCTVNLYLDSLSTFTQLNPEGYLFKVEDNSVLNIYANNAIIEGHIKVEGEGTVNLEMTNCIFNGVFCETEMEGTVNVKMISSTWNLSSDDYIYSLDIDADSTIFTNDYHLFVNGKVYNPIVDINDQYQAIELPTGRVLKVLRANDYNELATKQDSYLYFLYDKLEMWFDRSKFVTPFCIVENIPEDIFTMAPDVLYIHYLTGKLYILNDNTLKEVGYVEHDATGNSDPEQLAILASAGTAYFHNAESRYIDVQTRTIILPYQNGSYQICVNIPEDLKIDENTILYYDTEENQWKVAGHRTSTDFEVPFYNRLKPANSATVFTEILADNMIKSNLRISKREDNLIETAVNGIYVDGSVLTTVEEYQLLKDTVMLYRSVADRYLLELRNAVNSAVNNVSIELIEQKIMNTLANYESTIDTMVRDYNTMYDRLITVEVEADGNIDDKLNRAKQEIYDYLDGLVNPWRIFPEDITTPDHTPAENRHIAAALAYGREKIAEVAQGLPVSYVNSLPLSGIAIETIYAVWDSTDEVYILNIWNPETGAWDPYDTGRTPAMPASSETDYYRTVTVAKVNTNNNTITINEDPIEGFKYIDSSTGKKYLFNGETFELIT